MSSFSLLPTLTHKSPLNYIPVILHSLHLAIQHHSLKLTLQSHALSVILDLCENPFVLTKLVSSYASCRRLDSSKVLFNLARNKTTVLFNTLLSGCVKNNEFRYALQLFVEMRGRNVILDDFTLSIVSKLCGETREKCIGEYVHGKCLRYGFLSDVVVSNSMISMYGKCEMFDECLKIFEEMPDRNSASWNTIITDFFSKGSNEFSGNVWRLFREMHLDGLKPDAYTFSSVLPFCDRLDYGRELHCSIVKNALELISGSISDVHIGCCLVDMYCRLNKVVMGKRVFDLMGCRNVYAWTAMVDGYVSNGEMYAALRCFKDMQEEDGIEPNRVTIVSILPAFGSLNGLLGGKQIHGYAIRRYLNAETSLCNALVDMYCKCGSLSFAERVFEDDTFCKDPISWSSLISGYGLHGKGKEAVHLYVKMLSVGIKPDKITIVGVLSACCRAGLVNEGLSIYYTAANDYGIKPTLEICSCIVDMLGRSGKLDQALDFIMDMPVEPGPSVWGALISGSITHGNTSMQELAYRSLIHLEPENPSNYVSLSNLYASSEKWENVAEVRKMMKERSFSPKLPGCSWINIDSQTHQFYVADKTHHSSHLIYELLDDLTFMIKKAEYAAAFTGRHDTIV